MSATAIAGRLAHGSRMAAASAAAAAHAESLGRKVRPTVCSALLRSHAAQCSTHPTPHSTRTPRYALGATTIRACRSSPPSFRTVHVKRNGVCCCNAVSNRGSQSGAPRAAAATVSAAVTLTRQWVVEVEEAPALQSSSEASMSPGRLAQRSIQRGVPRSVPRGIARGQCNAVMQQNDVQHTV